jgi:PAS domain S-box-containing protein
MFLVFASIPFMVLAALAEEHEEAAHVVRESEGRFRLVANTAPVMIWMSGIDRLCTYFNHPWMEFTGRPLEAELGNGWVEGVHKEDLERCLKTYSEAFDQRQSFEMEYRLRRNDGEYRWILDIGVPRSNVDGSFAGYIGSCLDITDRKVAEEALGSVGRRLIEAHEEERKRIARELHDDIVQRIALLAIELEQCDHRVPDSLVDVHEYLQHARQRAYDLGNDIQALSHRLHSSKLEYLGLVAAAKSFCHELSKQRNVRIEFKHSDMPAAIPEEISLCLFRVLQEALQNALKHSADQNFTVEMHGTNEEISLTVSDSGIGFDWQDAMNRQGLGLISMRERLHLVNGELSIQSEPGRGTTVRAHVRLGQEVHPQAIAG